MKKNFEILICGAGMVGLTFALMMAKKKMHVCIIEKSKKKFLFNQLDSRTTAISQGSHRIYKQIGFWKEIQNEAQPINKIYVSEGLKPHDLRFTHDALNEGPLGYIVENKIIKYQLLKKVLSSKYITLLDNSEIREIQNLDINNSFIKTNNENIKFKLLVAADGRFSKTRYHANLKYFFHDYKQEAFIFNISHRQKHNGIALERFFPEGPMAILPVKSNKINRSSVVWTVDSKVSKEKKFKDNFKDEFTKKYNEFFGELKSVSEAKVYPLNVFSCYDYSKRNIVLIGDACQAIHPIAGQGFNLGLRDAMCLGNILKEFKQLGLEPHNANLLRMYQSKRSFDKNLLVSATHNLNKLFSSSNKFKSIFRQIGLKIFSRSRLLKNQSMLFAMGLRNF